MQRSRDWLDQAKRDLEHARQSIGLEWLFRLLTEPRRLWRRYLVNNPIFLTLVLLQVIGLGNTLWRSERLCKTFLFMV
jgi:N-acetylglucosaminyldiphosphoundecaprenol N-acetyl-beta-D-mannosaminyltransferase